MASSKASVKGSQELIDPRKVTILQRKFHKLQKELKEAERLLRAQKARQISALNREKKRDKQEKKKKVPKKRQMHKQAHKAEAVGANTVYGAFGGKANYMLRMGLDPNDTDHQNEARRHARALVRQKVQEYETTHRDHIQVIDQPPEAEDDGSDDGAGHDWEIDEV